MQANNQEQNYQARLKFVLHRGWFTFFTIRMFLLQKNSFEEILFSFKKFRYGEDIQVREYRLHIEKEQVHRRDFVLSNSTVLIHKLY